MSDLSNCAPSTVRRLAAICFLGLILFPGAICPSSAAEREPATVYPVSTTTARRTAQQQSNRARVNSIEEAIERAARSIRFTPPGGAVPPADAPPPNPPSSWFDQLWRLLFNIVTRVFRIIFVWLASYVVTLVHNPNIASPYNDRYEAATGDRIPYDLVGPNVKNGVRQGFAVMRALAINLLLLLFILAVWKSWTEAALKNGQALMGCVGRLIATAGLIVFWPVISYHVVQISNEMIDYVFRSIAPVDVELAIGRIGDLAASGTATVIFGQSVRVLGVPGHLLANLATRVVGSFLLFIFFGIAIHKCTHLIILKAVQTGLMMAQFMFAPMFLVFFATPDTERIAAGFVKSCIEVSLLTFVWAGLFRLVIVILSSGEGNVWGDFIMLLGVLQIMLQVPSFLGHAQISHVSDFLSPRGIISGLSSLWKSLADSGGQFKKWWDDFGSNRTKLKESGGKGSDSQSTSLNTPQGQNAPSSGTLSQSKVPKKKDSSGEGAAALDTQANADAANAAAAANAANAANAQSQSSTGANSNAATPGGANSAAAGGRRKAANNRFDRGSLAGKKVNKSLTDPLGNLAAQLEKGQIGEADGDSASIDHDGQKGVTGLTYGQHMTPQQRAHAFAVAALAQELMRNPAMRAALAESLGWKPNPLSSTPQKQLEKFNRAINKAAIRGAEAYLSGAKGNKGTELLNGAHGAMTSERLDEMIEGLMDSDLPHSVFNPNYSRNRQAVEGAGLKENPATMAFAASPEGSRLRGQSLAAGYAALAGSLGRELKAAGHAPGTRGYMSALGQAIRGSTSDRQKAACAVGVGLLGTGEADNFTDEDWEAWVNQAESVARTNGIRPDAAVGLLRGIMSTPAALAHAQQPGYNLATGLETAGRAIAAMREQRVPPQALAAQGFAGHMYNLAINDAQGNNKLTAKAVFAALKLAQGSGLEHFDAAESAQAELMLDGDPAVGGWAAGDIGNPYNMALVKEVKANGGTGSKRVCQRVVAAGRGINPVSVAAANHSALDGMNQAQAGFVVAAMLDGVESDGMVQAYRLGGEDANGLAVSMLSNLPSKTVQGYAALARQAPGATYAPDIVEEAVALESGGFGRISDLAGNMHRAVTSSRAHGDYLSPHKAAAGLRNAIHGGFVPSSRDNPNVLSTAADFTDAQLTDGDFMSAAKYGATMLSEYTPPHISHLSGIASAAQVPVGQVTSSAYEAVLEAVPVGGDLSAVASRQVIHGIVLAQAAADAVNLVPGSTDRQVFMRTVSLLQRHKEIGALSGSTLASVGSLAHGVAVEMVAQGGGTVEGHLTGMDADSRRVLVAVAERGTDESRSLSGGSLLDYVSAVRTVARDLGMKDYGHAVELIDGAALDRTTGTVDQGRIPRVLVAEQALGAVGASREARQSVGVVSVVTDLAGDPANAGRLPELAGAAVSAREVFQGQDYNAPNVLKLAGYMSAGGWGDRGMSRGEYDVIEKHIAPTGLAPARQLVERVVQFQSANPGTQIGTQQVLALLSQDSGKADMHGVNQVSGLVCAYAAAAAGIANPQTANQAEIAAMAVHLQHMPRGTFSTLLSIQQEGGGQAQGQELLRMVAAVRAVGGSGAGREVINFIVNDVPSNVIGSTAGIEALARAAELYTVAELSDPKNANVIPNIQSMGSQLGWQTNQIQRIDIERRDAIAAQIGATNANRVVVERIAQSGIEPGTQPLLVHIAMRPELSSFRGVDLRWACEAVQVYSDTLTGGTGTASAHQIDLLDSATVGACVAWQRFKGVTACDQTGDIDRIASESSLMAPNGPKGGIRYTVGGAQFVVDW